MRHQSGIAWSALVLLLAVPAAHAQQTAQAGVITALKPRDFIRRGQQPPQEAARGDQILWEDIIQTERGGRVRIGLLDGSILNIGSEAGVQILRHDAATQQSEILLNFGKMRALVRELGRPDSKFEVRTHTAVAGVIGTDEFIDASNPAYTCALSLGGVIFLRSDDLSIPGIEVLYPGEKSCVEEGRPPEPKRPATDEELQDALHSTAPTEISLQPAVAFPGTTVSAELTGQNLLPLESLTVSGEGVNATPLLEEATPTRIPLRIEVSPDASPGLRLITLRTPAGEESVDFVVLPPPGVGLALDLSPLTTPDTPFVLLRPGPQGPFQITARFEGPSPGPVTFALAGLPPGISHSFSAPQALPGQTIQLYFELTGDVSPGDYVAALGARAGLFAAAAAIYLRVPPPAGTPVIEVEVEHYPSPEQPPEILTGTEFRVWQGARLVFDASASSVPGGELTGFTWQVVNTPVGAAGPRFELDTWQLTPGTYRILLQVTSNFGQTAQQEFRLAVLALPNPDEVPFGLGRAIETLQVNEYMKWFHLVLFRDYPGLEERTRNSFQQLSAARVYVRLDNRQRSGYDAFYQVTYEIEFSTRDNPEQSQRRRESVTLRLLFLPGEGVWRIVDFAVTVSEIPGELILSTLELTTDPPTSESNPLALAPGETTELDLTVASDTVAGLVNLTAAAPSGLTVAFGSSQVPVNSTTDVFLTASPAAAAGPNQVLVAGQTSAVGGSVPIFLNITARPAVPVLSVNPTSVDFGDVPVGTPAERIVTVTNTGNADLILTDATISGSSAFSLPLDPEITPPVTLPPGATIEADVHFLPTAPGPVTGTLTIASNAGSGQVALAGTGVGIPAITLSVTSINFGDIIVGTTSLPSSVAAINTGTADLVIQNISLSGSSDFARVEVSLPLTVPQGGDISFDFIFSPIATGPLSATATFLTNAGSPTVALSGNGISAAVPQITVSPTSLDFGSIPVGTTSSPLTVTVSNTGTADLILDSLQVTPTPPFAKIPQSFPITIPPSGSHAFQFTFGPLGTGPQSGTVTFSSNAGSASVSLSGSGISAVGPVLSVNPTSVDFGDVLVGATSLPISVTVMNAGSADLTVNSVFFTGSSAFSLSAPLPSFPVVLPPGGSFNVDHTFSPSGTGLATGTMTVSSNAGTVDVPFTGNGIAGGPQISVSPPSINFGDVVVGTSSSQDVTISNIGSADLSISSLFLSPGTGQFLTNIDIVLPTVLTPGQSLIVPIVFGPTLIGSQSDSFVIDSNAGMPTVALSGTGVAGTPQISVSPSSLAFGNVAVGSFLTLDVTISNVGSADLMINDISTSCGAPAIPFECGFQPETTGFSFPLTIPPGGVPITLSVTYQPSCAPCSDSDDLQISSNDPANPTVSVPLTGNGVAAPVISSVFAGSPIEGATASITGSGFSTVLADNTVLFTDVKGTQAAVTPTTATSTSMQFTIPSGKVAGGATVQVSVSGVLSNQVSFDLHPHLLTISPSSGPVGTTVTITGTSFDTVLGTGFGTPGTSIVFGGSLAATVLSATNTDVQFQVPTGLGTGIKSVAAIVNSRGSDNDQIFTVTGPAIQVNPTSLDFPNVPEGASSTQNLTISNIGNLNLTITNIDEAISCDGSGFCEDDSAALPYPKVLTPGSSIIVPVTYQPFSAPSSDSSSINISSDDPSTPFLSVPLTGNSLVAFTLSPIDHDFGLVPVGMSSSPLTVTITNTSGTTLNITDIFSSPTTVFVVDPSLTNTSLGPGATTTFDVTFILASPGEVFGFIQINTNLVSKGLSVHGEGGLAGMGFTVTPSPVDFGTFTLGSSSSPAIFTISNFTLVPLTVNSVTSTHFQFTVAGAPTVVPASSDGITPGTATFTVTYTASLEGRTEAGIRTETPLGVEYCEVIGTGIAPVPIRIAESGEEPPPQAPGEPAPDDSADPVRSSIHRRGQTNRQIRGGSLPELLVRAEEVRVEPRRVRPGETVRFRVPVHNRGGGAAQGVVVEFAIPELGLRHRETVDLASGERVVLVFEIEFSADDLRQPLRPQISVDPDGQFQEARRDNNLARLRPLAAVGGPRPIVGRRGNRLQRARLVVAPGECVGFRFRSGQTACGRDADIELSIAADGFTPLLRAEALEALNVSTFAEVDELPELLRATELPLEPGRLLVVRPRSGAPVLVQVRAVRRTSAVRAPRSGRPRQVDAPRTRRFPAEPSDLPTQGAGGGVRALVQVELEWRGGR